MTTSEMLALLKGKAYLDLSVDTFDSALTHLIESIEARAANYVGADRELTLEDATNDLIQALAKQITFEFRRREDLGLESVTYPDGSINKVTSEEWLPTVKAVLDRIMGIWV